MLELVERSDCGERKEGAGGNLKYWGEEGVPGIGEKGAPLFQSWCL